MQTNFSPFFRKTAIAKSVGVFLFLYLILVGAVLAGTNGERKKVDF
jgi:hypothetical protein